MPPTIMGNGAEAVRRQQEELFVPRIGVQRPSVTEDDWLSGAPILIKDVRAVSCRDRWHSDLQCIWVFRDESLLSKNDQVHRAAHTGHWLLGQCMEAAGLVLGVHLSSRHQRDPTLRPKTIESGGQFLRIRQPNRRR